MNISLLFVNYSNSVELSFLRHNKFFESWTIGTNDDKIKTFAMTGSLKEFKKFVTNKNDKSFDLETRNTLSLIDKKYSILWT